MTTPKKSSFTGSKYLAQNKKRAFQKFQSVGTFLAAKKSITNDFLNAKEEESHEIQ
jgi:hypothetical protein